MTVDDHCPRAHGVCDAVLGIAPDDDLRSIHEAREIVAGYARHDDVDIAPEARADVPLAADVAEKDLLSAVRQHRSNALVELAVA